MTVGRPEMVPVWESRVSPLFARVSGLVASMAKSVALPPNAVAVLLVMVPPTW